MVRHEPKDRLRARPGAGLAVILGAGLGAGLGVVLALFVAGPARADMPNPTPPPPVVKPANGLMLALLTPHPQWGRPLRLQLYPARPGTTVLPLGRIDLTPWQEDFAILASEPGRRADGRAQLTLTLAPRRSGRLTLPPLHLGTRHSAALSLDIAPPRLDGQPLTVRLELPPGALWQGQQAVVRVHIDSPRRFARLDSPPPATDAALPLLGLPLTRQPDPTGGSRLATGWVLFAEPATRTQAASGATPARPGNGNTVMLELPPVRYLIDGVPRLTFYLPRLRLQLRPLPEYVPPATPVGRLDLLPGTPPGHWLRTGHLQFWRLRLRGAGIAPQNLPDVSAHLHGGRDIVLLDSARRVQRRLDSHGLTGEADFTLSFKTRRSGWLQLPQLRLRYFDPADGRLKTLISPARGVLSLNLFWLLALLAVTVAAAAWLLWHGARSIQRRYRTRQARQQALQALRTSHDVGQLRAALHRLARAEGWPDNLSLGQWRQHWMCRYRSAAGLAPTLARLERACYGGQDESDFADLRWHLQFYLRAPRRRPGHGQAHLHGLRQRWRQVWEPRRSGLVPDTMGREKG